MIIVLVIQLISASNLNCADSACTSCTSGYTYRSISCVSVCPENSILSGDNCPVQSENPFIKLDFSYFFSYSSTKIGNFEHPDGLAFQDSMKKSPIPTRLQGFYFTTTSSLVSNKNWVLAPTFNLEFYIKVNTDGTIFTISESSTQYFNCYVLNGFIYFSIKFLSNGVWTNKVVSEEIDSSWYSFNMGVGLEIGLSRIYTFGNVVLTILNAEFRTIQNLVYTIGDSSSSYKGFLYYFFMSNNLIYTLNVAMAPVSCDYLEYYDSDADSCVDCSSGCSDWPWCIRYPSCSTCFDTTCSSCRGFSLFYCDSCTNSNDAPYCSFGPNCASGSIFFCDSCDSGYDLISGVCINPPYNYVDGSIVPVINIRFDYLTQYYGIFYSGYDGDTYAPFNDMGSSDPYPVYNRGLYFDSDDHLTSRIEISLNSEFSVAIWFYKPELTFGGLLYGSKFAIDDSYSVYIHLKDFEESLKFISKSFFYNYGYWSFYTVSIQLNGGYTSLGIGIDGNFFIDSFIEGYYFDNSPSIYTIGEEFWPVDYFKGFLYSLTIWQYYKTDFSLDEDPCELLSTCLWVIDVIYYYNEYEDKIFECDSSCQYGCRTWGTCNQCDSIKCSVCSSYYSSCTDNLVSSCLTDTHATAYNKCCDLKCLDCYGLGYYRCLECDSGYFHLGNLCLDSCPSFTNQNGNECEISQELVIQVSFDTISKVIEDSVNQIKFVSGNSAQFWPHMDDADPIPAYKRGYFFKNSSFITSDTFSVSHNVSIVAFLKIKETGIVFQKDKFKLVTDDNFATFSYEAINFEFNAIPNDIWHVIILTYFSDIDGLMTVNFQIKGGTLNSLISSNVLILIDTNSALILGDSSQSFIGFIWEVQIFYSIYNLNSVNLNVCSNSEDLSCVWDCDIQDYLIINTCSPCLAECSTGCRSNLYCSICSNQYCSTCSNYINCGDCPNNSELTQYGCVCFEGYQMKNLVCEYCSYYIESFCVAKCPIGYYSEGRECLVQNNNGQVAEFIFNKPNSVFIDRISGFTAEIIDANQTFPAYLRGIYFTGNYSSLILPTVPNDKLIFGIRFFICFWLYPGGSGMVISKDSSGEDLIKVYLEDFEINIEIQLSFEQIISRSENKLKKEIWSHIIIAFDNNGDSELSMYINGQSEYIKQNSDYLTDTVNGGIILGAFSDQSFSGFIYSFEFWLALPEFSQLYKQPCGKCNICPLSGGCLSACNISMFDLYNSCEFCIEECETGCRYGSNCSLCEDENCNLCDTYNKKSCLDCSSGFILKQDLCIPCEENYYFEAQTKTCKPCKGLCKTCSSYNECLSCIELSELINGSCKCLEGYYENNGCVRRLFNCVLKIDKNNNMILLFTEELSTKLDKEDLSIKIDQIEVEFKLNELSGFEYQIVIQGEVYETKKKLVVYFLSNLSSNRNSLLGINQIEATLFVKKANNYESTLTVIEGHTTTVFLSSIGLMAGLSMINLNPKSFYTFLNSAELFSYTILYNIDLDSDLLEFLKSIQITSNVPSVFDLLNIEDYNIPEQKLTYFGFDTIFIYKTSGFFISTLILMFFINLLAKITDFIGVCSRILKYFTYKIYLRYWIQTFFELFVGSLIALRYLSYNNIPQITNLILCFLILILQSLAFIALMFAVYKMSKLISQEEKILFKSKYGELFDEFKEDGIHSWLFYILFIVRRIIISFLIIFIEEFIIQLSISITLSLVVLFYVIYSRCYKSKIFEVYFIFCELCVFIFYCLIFLTSFSGLKKHKKISYVCILIVLSVLLLTLISTLGNTIINVIGLCRKKKKFAIGITPANEIPEFRISRHESLKIFQYSNLSKSASFNNFEENPRNSFMSVEDKNNSMLSIEEINND